MKQYDCFCWCLFYFCPRQIVFFFVFLQSLPNCCFHSLLYFFFLTFLIPLCRFFPWISPGKLRQVLGNLPDSVRYSSAVPMGPWDRDTYIRSKGIPFIIPWSGLVLEFQNDKYLYWASQSPLSASVERLIGAVVRHVMCGSGVRAFCYYSCPVSFLVVLHFPETSYIVR